MNSAIHQVVAWGDSPRFIYAGIKHFIRVWRPGLVSWVSEQCFLRGLSHWAIRSDLYMSEPNMSIVFAGPWVSLLFEQYHPPGRVVAFGDSRRFCSSFQAHQPRPPNTIDVFGSGITDVHDSPNATTLAASNVCSETTSSPTTPQLV